MPFATIKEVADRMRQSHFAVRRLIKAGKIDARRIGNGQWRIKVDIDGWPLTKE